MARKHTAWLESDNGLCGKPMQPTGPRDLDCMSCQDIQRVMRAVQMAADEVGILIVKYPHGNNACRIECDTTAPEFKKFAALMRRGLDIHRTGTLYPFSVRGKTATGAIIRHMAG